MPRAEDEASEAKFWGPDVRLVKVTRFAVETCRCGKRIFAGDERFEISHAPESIQLLVRDRGFCSKVCVRAFMLEALSELEATSAPNLDQTVNALRETYLDLSRSFSELAFDLANPSG